MGEVRLLVGGEVVSEMLGGCGEDWGGVLWLRGVFVLSGPLELLGGGGMVSE